MEKVKERISRQLRPVPKIIMLHSVDKPDVENKQTQPPPNLYPKVKMPEQAHGYLKVKESDFL